ncbi:MAG: hypothetical protein ACHQHN_08105 [Sphingobacteriales bacterium]
MSFGAERMIEDLKSLGFDRASLIKDVENTTYALIPDYKIPAGSFEGTFVDLAIPTPSDFPRSTGASIHIRRNPHLVGFGNVPGVRNVIVSKLGTEWQYWSYRFILSSTTPTSQLLSQINGIFRKN